LRIKDRNADEIDARDWVVGSSVFIRTNEDYLEAVKYGEKEARKFLGGLSEPLTIENLEQVHGHLFGEIYGSSGEFKEGFDAQDFAMLKKQSEDLNNSELSREESIQLIAEQHVELVETEAFGYGNKETANLITEWRMEQVFGEREWQGLERVDAENWDRAVENQDAGIVAGFLENQLQDAINYEENPLGEFQGDGKEKLTRKEIKEAKAEDRKAEARLAELNAKGDDYREKLAKKIAEQKKEQPQVNLALENLPKPKNNQSL